MKFLVLFVVFFSYIYATPLWYYNIKKSDSQVIIGYGSGSDENTAKQNALSDVVSKISVDVKTSVKIMQKDEDGHLVQNSSYDTEQKADAVLSDYKLLKVEYEDGKFYVALSYENIPSFDKFVRKVRSSTVKTVPPKLENGYLSHTPMAKKLKKVLGRDINFRLLRKDKKWYIKYGSVMQVLDKRDFGRFFVTIPNKNITINTNKRDNILYDGDRFYFKVNSKQNGFVSILTVYEDGTVSSLVRNIDIRKNRVENIPDEEFESIPEAGLIKKGVETYDLYVAIFSKKRLHFEQFAYADDELISEEKYKNFDELIEFLDGKDYTTLKVVTKPRL